MNANYLARGLALGTKGDDLFAPTRTQTIHRTPVAGQLTHQKSLYLTLPTAIQELPEVEAEEVDSLTFPLGWVAENASPAIVYRAFAEVCPVARDSTDLSMLPYAHRPALRLAMSQQRDGIWNGSMLSIPSRSSTGFSGVGTIQAVRRLAEYGWSADSPPLLLARRLLFRLLAEDNDPAFLFELAQKTRDDDLVRRNRTLLREASAAALAQLGYESDPRLRGAARRILERITAFLESPLGEKPWVRIGNTHVLSAEAAPPSLYTLTMLAHMPIFRHEHHTAVERIFEYMKQSLPRQEAIQVFGKRFVPQPQLVLGDVLPHRNAVEADVPFALLWLETMARLGFLKRHDGWLRMYERFVDDRGRDGVWHPHKGAGIPHSSNPWAWPSFPLDEGTNPLAKWSDITLRVGLIGKLLGKEIEPI